MEDASITRENVAEDEAGEAAVAVSAKVVDDQLIDELVSRAQAEGLQLTGEGGLLQQLTKRLLESALEAEFADAWGRKYPAIVKLWENAWEEFTPFLRFDTEIRRIVCTTNAIESVNARIRTGSQGPGTLLQRASRPEVCLHGDHVARPHGQGPGQGSHGHLA